MPEPEDSRLKYDALQRAMAILQAAQPKEGEEANPQLQYEAQAKAYATLVDYLRPPPPARKVVKLSDLQKMVGETFTVEIEMPMQGLVSVEGHRLSPAEVDVFQSVINEVLPPQVKGTPADKPQFNEFEPEYVKRKKKAFKLARALALYWAYPMFAGEKPGLEKHEEIYAFIQSRLTDSILDALLHPLNDWGLRKVALVNFISGSSPTS